MADSKSSPWFFVKKILLATEVACSPTPILLGMLATLCVWGAELALQLPQPLRKSETGCSFLLNSEYSIQETSDQLLWCWRSVSLPQGGPVTHTGELRNVLATTPPSFFRDSKRVLLGRIVSLAIWSFFGVVFARLYAFRLNGKESASLPALLKLGKSRFLMAISSPLIPLLSVAILSAGVRVYGTVCVWPGIGAPLLLVTQWLISLVCMMISVILLVTLIAWPLMIVAVGVDDCDGFGGLSRTFSYLTSRFWVFAGLLALSATAGAVVLFVGNGILGLATLTELQFVKVDDQCVALENGTGIQGEWFYLLLNRGFSGCLFWSFVTAMYLLLRQSADAVPFDEIAPLAEELPPRVAFPVVGMAANPLPPGEPQPGDSSPTGGEPSATPTSPPES